MGNHCSKLTLIFMLLVLLVFPSLLSMTPPVALMLMLGTATATAWMTSYFTVWVEVILLLVFVGGIFISFLFMAMLSKPQTPPSRSLLVPLIFIFLGSYFSSTNYSAILSGIGQPTSCSLSELYCLIIIALMSALVFAVKISAHSHFQSEVCL